VKKHDGLIIFYDVLWDQGIGGVKYVTMTLGPDWVKISTPGHDIEDDYIKLERIKRFGVVQSLQLFQMEVIKTYDSYVVHIYTTACKQIMEALQRMIQSIMESRKNRDSPNVLKMMGL